MIFLMYYLIQFASVLLSIFASMFISDIQPPSLFRDMKAGRARKPSPCSPTPCMVLPSHGLAADLQVWCPSLSYYRTWSCFRFLLFSFLYIYIYINTYQFSSVTQSCPTLCDPMNRSTPGLPVHHQLLEFTQTHVHRVDDAIQPSHPLSSPFPPAPNPSQHQSLFQWVNSSHEVAKVLEFQL